VSRGRWWSTQKAKDGREERKQEGTRPLPGCSASGDWTELILCPDRLKMEGKREDTAGIVGRQLEGPYCPHLSPCRSSINASICSHRERLHPVRHGGLGMGARSNNTANREATTGQRLSRVKTRSCILQGSCNLEGEDRGKVGQNRVPAGQQPG
jgi:hypothetical protein